MIIKILFFLGVVGMILLAIGIYDGHRFVVVKSTYEVPKISKDFKFILISDLHNCSYGKENEKLYKQIEQLEPDAILIAGDLLTSKKGQKIDNTVSLMKKLCDKWPVYYAMGNHETKLKLYPEAFQDQFNDFQKKTDFPNKHILQNDKIKLEEENIEICGLELERAYYKRFKKKELSMQHLEELIGKSNEDVYQILLAHNPDYFEEYADWGADLILSGHVHGGIMKLPVLGGVLSPSLHLFPKYDGGKFVKGDTKMILSRGMGAHSIPLRFFNPAELHVIELKKDTNCN